MHDFDQQESYSPALVEAVLSKIAAQVDELDIHAIGLQALGHFHGPESLEGVVNRITAHPWPECLEKIWIVVK